MTKMRSEIAEQPGVLPKLARVNDSTLKLIAHQYQSRDISNIVIAGRGTSDYASIFAQYLFGIRLGANVALAQPSVVTLYDGKPNYRQSMVIAVSQSGHAQDALAVLEEGKRQGAITVAVTNDTSSPLAERAEFSLYCAAGPEVSVAATKTFTSEMALLYLLCAACGDDKELYELYDKISPAMEALLSRSDEISALAQNYRDMKSGFVLSRGLGYAIALEATLKLQETCYIEMKGFSISDFYHGPLAQVTPDTNVIVYMANGKAAKDAQAILAKLNEIGNVPLFVTDDAALSEGLQVKLFTVPATGSELTQNFIFAVFAQLFACSLSSVKGLNPDAPRNLNKVTITV